jgi:hypothetical protein
MRILNDAGLIDRAILNQEIEAILIQEQSDRPGNLPAVELVQDYVEAAIRSARSGDSGQRPTGHRAAESGFG